MADITRYPLARHLRGTPAQHVRHLRRGKVVHDGAGLSFFFRPLSAVLSEVPVDDRELAVLFHARSADFQDVTVQASVTFRVSDPALACSRMYRSPPVVEVIRSRTSMSAFGVDAGAGRFT